MIADYGPPLFMMAIGLVLWLTVTATVAGISIHTIGIILFLVSIVWLALEMYRTRTANRVVVDEPVLYRARRP